MLKIKKLLPGYQPLCYVENKVLLAKNKRLFLCDGNLENIRFLCEFPVSYIEKCAAKFRLLSRIFRLQFRYALNVLDKFVLLVFRNEIWKVNLETCEVTLDFIIPDNRTALYLTLAENKNGHPSRVIFGEYFSNPDKGIVRIWGAELESSLDWQVLHEFEQHEINHIHNIIYDKNNDNLYILTGDFGDGAGIWMSNSALTNVVPIVRGKQVYRACWALIRDTGLTYATDTQLEENAICRLVDGHLTRSETIEGSSIYFGENRTSLYFSTTVEPGEPSGNFLVDLFSRKLGRGVLSEKANIYSLDGKNSISIEFQGLKDMLPPRLAQFGSFTFPSGVSNNKDIIAYGVALESFDGCCILLGEEC
jgi:hypothetical protein